MFERLNKAVENIFNAKSDFLQKPKMIVMAESTNMIKRTAHMTEADELTEFEQELFAESVNAVDIKGLSVADAKTKLLNTLK